MRDEKKRKTSQRRESPESPGEGDDEDFISTRTPASTPFPYPDYGEDEDDDDDDDGNLLEVIIDTLTGTTFQVRVSPWETGAGLKGLLHRTQGISSSDQHILLGTRELVDEIPLIDQGVQDGANLRLVLAMKGGPINTGRPPQEDALWREFADYMDVNREELWDGAPGKPVTLLVLKEGENVNLYRVVENQDGTFSPLNESWGSNASISGKTNVSSNQKSHGDEVLHQQRMIDLNTQMEALKLRRKERRIAKNPSSKATSPRVSIPTSRARRVRYNMSQSQKINREPPSLNHSVKKLSKSAGGPLDLNPKRASAAPPPRVPLSVPPSAPHPPSRFLSTRGSTRPSTQESGGAAFDVRRPSVSRGSKVLDEIPRSQPPKHVDFSSYKKLDSIKAPLKRNSLGPLTEDENQSSSAASVKGSKTEESPKNYDVYRKTLVKHGREAREAKEGTDKEGENNELRELQIRDANQSREAWSGRDVPLPLYMERPRKERAHNRLYQSHNFGSLRPSRYFDDRPKTSPEVLERRTGSATDSSTMSERIQLRGPDDKLRELITILNTSRANSRLSQRSTPPSFHFPKSSKSFPLPKTSRSSGKTSLSVSLASSLRGLSPPTVPSTPELNAFLNSDSTTQRDFLRELAKAQGIGRRPSSKRNTPEGSRRNSRRPGSGGGGAQFKIVSTPRGFVPATPQKKKKALPRCNQCKKKIGVSSTYPCRCGQLFCAQHRYSEAHECTYDYKTAGRKLLELANPLVVPPKLPKI